MNVLAIDQGTSATKALVIAPGGSVLGQASARVHPQPGAGGAVIQAPRELLDSVLEAGRRALADAGEDVGAVGLGNQGETVLAWDPATGHTHGPAISWQDRRAAGVVGALAEHADRLTEVSGLPLDPYFAAPKMRWLAEETGGEATITGAEPADVAALSGRTVAGSVLDYLSGAAWPAAPVRVVCQPPLHWIVPNLIIRGEPARWFRLRAREILHDVRIEAIQDGRVLARQRLPRVMPGRSARLGAGWMDQVDPAGLVVEVRVGSARFGTKRRAERPKHQTGER